MLRLVEITKSAGILILVILLLPLLILAQFRTDRLKDDGNMDDPMRPF